MAVRRKNYPVAVTLLIWAILTPFAYAFTGAEALVYQSATSMDIVNPIVNEVPDFVSIPVEDVYKPETLVRKIDRVADENGIPRWKLHALIQCESSYNPKAKNITKAESSHGIAQINLKAHAVTVNQAQDPDFALAFIVKNWSKRHQVWYHCSRNNAL